MLLFAFGVGKLVGGWVGGNSKLTNGNTLLWCMEVLRCTQDTCAECMQDSMHPTPLGSRLVTQRFQLIGPLVQEL